MKLETQRLELVPLDVNNLASAIEDYGEMEKELGLSVTETNLDAEMQYAMKARHRKVLEDIENYFWLTNWAVVLKEDNCIIGYIVLKGRPNENGEVIVGYVIDEKYRRRGFATEALLALKEWIFMNPQAKYIIADTEKLNIPSHRVLEHLGAVKYMETNELIWWRIANEAAQ